MAAATWAAAAAGGVCNWARMLKWAKAVHAISSGGKQSAPADVKCHVASAPNNRNKRNVPGEA
eukprot:4312709-Alexandrium_andersonii.AAC.1